VFVSSDNPPDLTTAGISPVAGCRARAQSCKIGDCICKPAQPRPSSAAHEPRVVLERMLAGVSTRRFGRTSRICTSLRQAAGEHAPEQEAISAPRIGATGARAIRTTIPAWVAPPRARGRGGRAPWLFPLDRCGAPRRVPPPLQAHNIIDFFLHQRYVADAIARRDVAEPRKRSRGWQHPGRSRLERTREPTHAASGYFQDSGHGTADLCFGGRCLPRRG
jgi:hypothetical protein